MEDKTNYLISQVLAINKKYENIQDITGEGFNIFKILKLETKETKTHSSFIAELLNPKGSHGQKDTFLKLFIKHILKDELLFKTEKAKVEIEKYIGFINIEKTLGGRLDICVTDEDKKQIYIENKLYAPDQENQLLRYHQNNSDATLLYLCIDREEVSTFSKAHLIEGEHFYLITYKHDIIPWLIECRKESVNHPILRESISQYINLIKYITGQTINETMNQEIVNLLIKDKESLKAAANIQDSLESVWEKLLESFYKILDDLGSELDLEVDYDINWNRNHTGFWFRKKNWTKLSIYFQFNAKTRNLVYGVCREEETKILNDELTQKLIEKLSHLNSDNSNGWWIFVKNMQSPYDNWDNLDSWLAIMDGTIKDVIKNKVIEIFEIIKDFDGQL